MKIKTQTKNQVFEHILQSFPKIPNENKVLPIYANSGGINICQLGISRPDGFPLPQIILSRTGLGYLEIYNKKYTIKPNEIIILPANTPHAYYPVAPNSKWYQDWITFDGSDVRTVLNSAGLDSFEIVAFENTEEIHTEISRTVLEMETYKPNMQILLMAHVLNVISLISKRKLKCNNAYSNFSLTKMINYIEANYKKNITLLDISTSANITTQHACRLFKEHLNTSPNNYLTNFRLGKSKSLLLQFPNFTNDEIAELTGFTSGAYFCFVFKKNEGITPTQFKNNY